jgi:protocatechuate 3,4-dioxygenase beta subunit
MQNRRDSLVVTAPYETLSRANLDRRAVLRAGLFGLGTAVALAVARNAGATAAIPVDGGVCAPTEDNIEGPYYRGGAPVRSDLVQPGMQGTRLEISGTVRSARCVPLAGAVIEAWQADSAGRYDLRGYTLRGTLVADDRGRYSLRTILPGHYLNGDRFRPAHVHLKIRAPGHRPLTTQLYFAGDPYNGGDPFIRSSLIMPLARDGGSLHAARDLVLLPT